MKYKSYLELIIYAICPIGNYASRSCFLKTEILEENRTKNCETVRTEEATARQ